MQGQGRLQVQLIVAERTVSKFGVPDLGIGVGFRIPHYREVVEQRPEMGWFEIISENFMVDGGSPRYFLDRLRDAYPVVQHGVAMSLGGAEDVSHTRRLKALAEEIRPPWVSDHLCFSGNAHNRLHDLVPLPYTASMRDHVVDRIRKTQDELGLPFAVENVSSYLTYRDSVQSEWDFLAEVVERADCALLLDVNNVFVSACNHGFDPMAYLRAMPMERVVQIHLAGHTIKPNYRLDTHDGPVCDDVWELYREAIRRTGPVSTLIEWDAHIPSFERLQQEAQLAGRWREESLNAPV